GLGAGLQPRSHEEADPDAGHFISERTVGLPFSPTYRSVLEELRQPTGIVVIQESGGNWLSWSVLSSVLGAVCVVGWWLSLAGPPSPEGRRQTGLRPEA